MYVWVPTASTVPFSGVFREIPLAAEEASMWPLAQRTTVRELTLRVSATWPLSSIEQIADLAA